MLDARRANAADADPTGERYCFEGGTSKHEAGVAWSAIEVVPVMDEAELMDLLRIHDAL